MKPHLSMRSGNPALNSKVFTTAVQDGSEPMTIQGTVNKTTISLLLLMLTVLLDSVTLIGVSVTQVMI